MAYVNEKISEEDFEKYNLAAIRKRLPYGSPNDHWAIDREKDIWFRKYYTSIDIENSGAESYIVWDFYWKGSLVSVDTETIDKGRFDGIYYAHMKILNIEIPDNILRYKTQILKDLKEIFEASNAGGGIYSNANGFKVDLEYEGQLI
jgi:hypothetical protein